jgi:hypothetical protein
MRLFPWNKKQSSGIFVCQKNGTYTEFTGKAGNNSINDIASHLGYHPDEAFTYHCNSSPEAPIQNVIFEIFTQNVIFVLTPKTITKLTSKMVNAYLKDFSFKKVYNRMYTGFILDNGIKNKSLKIDYLSKVLGIEDPEPDGMFYIKSLSLNLFFIDGVLVSYQSSDGLSHWAKQLQGSNPSFISAYEEVARKFHGTDLGRVINEINVQADAWAAIPKVSENEFIELHRSSYGTINFEMLQVCHYGKQISFTEFHDINKGRYSDISQPGDLIKRYSLDRFMYEFFKDGTLKDVTQVW